MLLWNLDEKDFKMEKNDDDEHANKDAPVETIISDLRYHADAVHGIQTKKILRLK